MTIAGCDPVFPELATAGLGRDRIVDPAEVARRDPEVIFASWCGRRSEGVDSRAAWVGCVAAVRENRIFEVKSTYILQPGPACLTEGVRQLHALLAGVHGLPLDPPIAPAERLDQPRTVSNG